MKAAKTTFIIGAGASHEFGLPVGSELRDRIRIMIEEHLGAVTRHSQDHPQLPIVNKWNDHELGWPAIHSGAKKLISALPTSLSIDDCLHTHSDDRGAEFLGKFFIAKSILQAEHESCLVPSPSNNVATNFNLKQVHPKPRSSEATARPLSAWESWLAILFQNLTAQCRHDEIPKRLQRVKFLIFNYDRCIEHALEHFIFWKTGAQDTKAARDIVASMDIEHVYGKIADLHGNAHDHAPFGAEPSESQLLKYALNIRTFTEKTEDDIAHKARAAIHESKNVVFLGFSFLDINMRLLADERTSKRSPQYCYGTSRGLSPADTTGAEDAINGWVANTGTERINLEPKTCADYMLENRRVFGFTS